jgi:hypothetical protein
MCTKYPGELGKRRESAEVLDHRVGLRLITGEAGKTGPEDDAQVDLLANRDYYDERIRLLAEHYGIAASVPKSVIINFVLPPDGAFWRELSLKLLKDNVECFMPGPPPRSGRPPTRQRCYAGLDLALKVISEKRTSPSGENTKMLEIFGFSPDRLPSTAKRAKEIFAQKWATRVSTVDREFRRWKRTRRGGNSAK